MFQLNKPHSTLFPFLQPQANQWSVCENGRAVGVLMRRKEESIGTKKGKARDERSAAIRRLTEKGKEAFILKPKHLAIVRAALTFWDEEMGAAHDCYRHYLHSRDQDVVFSPEDIVAVRAYFNDVVHKFGLLNDDSGLLLSTTLVEKSDDLICEPDQKIVSVLIR